MITVDTGPLRAEGSVKSIGRRAAFAEAKLTGADGKLYACTIPHDGDATLWCSRWAR